MKNIRNNDLDVIRLYMNKEQTNKPFHLPYHNYAGPGTSILSNLMNDVKPTTYLDKVSREHDVEYIKPNNQKKADSEMVSKLYKHYWYAPQIGAITRVAFWLKDWLKLKNDEETDEKVYEIAKNLLQDIENKENS